MATAENECTPISALLRFRKRRQPQVPPEHTYTPCDFGFDIPIQVGALLCATIRIFSFIAMHFLHALCVR